MNLSCESVTKKIRNSTVIDNISFQWNGSNVYGLCGSNGSGKTMLLRIISGLIFPTSGCVKVNGKILGKDLEFPPSMGMLLENPSFLNPYTGKKNLELIASLNGGKEDDVRKAILAVGLSPDDSRKYKKYSLGMKQRLGIAAAIMENPEILILDEPTNALDEEGIRVLIEIIKDMKEKGSLIVIASHDRIFLNTISDYIYTIKQGKFIDIMCNTGGSK